MLQNPLGKLSQELGVVNALLYLLHRGLKMISESFSLTKYYLVKQSLSNQPLLPQGKGRQIQVRELFVHESVHPCPRPPAVIAQRYEQGAVCLAAYKADEFAGCLWYCKNQYQEDEVRCVYQFTPDRAVWDFDVYVEPKFRLSPVFLRLWDEASKNLINQGYNYSLSRISAFNAMSLSSHKRMGAVSIGWAVFLQLGVVQMAIASLSPFIHVSFSKSSFPVFTLNIN